ncbi:MULTISPECIES: S-methyl-5-thioribose-1-phosphate isomerase [unclassified Oceanobacter]|jgi:methylthioribose-1-phosphate isomerase|uniref:S-methyl-5-thioribose-1-phosphate isomerase n=1 Tax=unclassified Oceanobacter TaxID=2620260 RepID=UPI0026E1CBEB|nr:MULTISPECIES: S-methyl-5-thioribose-1-phosphate isomerase [unclassified Oceanobacter]MDO6683158.1 S-methyl-5-thioribose-1-phosphate isomerase [Oceanobacter sp. 5_MG-2023]MDP2549081.1 S-methyl-5-thioribose-1-phosphate isomerase [Oceanobacter sp. 4_MG-2023]MDP2609496.1 S-methyl-5-thioribose-1-phosphate isomerase [Oceanobacter sp. 1_MG-2023]MDP2612804.1 S-methyl-5-thioribose-1-phosphate isomerase [Oceanobacter sp. 2_MG-2023]
MSLHSQVVAIEWRQQTLHLLDQRILPHQHQLVECHSAADAADAIRSMVVRGAPAIGITAAYGFALDALAGRDLDIAYQVLAESRPTAVNLFWALERMAALTNANGQQLLAEARRIHEEDIQANLTMGQWGSELLGDQTTVYTHCNTGALATGGHGTALGVIRSAWADGKIRHVYAGETRPWLQGARLTAWELMQDGIPVSLVCDGAAAQLFRQGDTAWVIVGADRITANGDVANKIGTYSLAVLARHHGMKFMVVAPSTTFDLSLPSGADIPIEQRPMTEVTRLQGIQIAPDDCQAINPSFDVTPAGLIDAIVTERGVIHQPSVASVAALLATH